MPKWLKYSFLAPVLLLLVYAVTVQVLRAVAMGEEEEAALALMQPPPPVLAGDSGFKYLAFGDRDVPPAALDAAMAAEVAAFRAWHEGSGPRSLVRGGTGESFASPAAADYPLREPWARPDAACGLSQLDCHDHLRGHEAQVRDWLTRSAERLALADQALRAESLANPHPPAGDMPFAGFQQLTLPLNAAALQALDGDTAGATARACVQLAASRRFLAQDGLLIDKMVHAAQADAAGSLLMSLRRQDPALPLPAGCDHALRPVDPSDYRVCGALRSEYAMMADYIRRNDRAMAESGAIKHVLTRWLLTDVTLLQGWNAARYAPYCSAEGLALVDAGQVPTPRPHAFSKASVDYWAAPISYILAAIAAPDYGKYQRRLLDSAAKLRLHLAVIAVAEGRLAAADLPAAASSPGYAVQVQGSDWRLPLGESRGKQPSERRIPMDVAPLPSP